MIDDYWDHIKQFSTYTERRRYLREQFENLLTHLEFGNAFPHDVLIGNAIKNLDSSSAKYLWEKALHRREQDADGAITVARSLFESVCKKILVDRNIEYDEGAELPKLYKVTARCLNLAPENHINEILKQILSGVQTTVNGFASLRNKFSDAHGLPNSSYRPDKRHAELVVNLVGSTAVFLIQTHQAAFVHRKAAS